MSTTTAFSSVTLKQARAWIAQLAPAKDKGATGVMFVGDWIPSDKPRRFVIAALLPRKAPISEPIFDIEGMTLTVPISIAPEAFHKACLSFGARVERRQRDLADRFDFVGDSAGVGHTVHAYHHVSICGSKGPWTIGLTPSSKCDRCASVAATKPKHRVRYAPDQAAAGANS